MYELRERLSGREFADWRLYLAEKERRREKLEYYFTELILLLGSFHGVEIDPEEVLIDWNAEEKEPAAPPDPLALALALARNLGAIVIDNRK